MLTLNAKKNKLVSKSAISRFQLTERDIDILRFIGDFGFCAMPQLNRRFNLKKPWNYQLIQRLTHAQLLQHDRVFHNQPGVFRLTSEGARFTDLPPLQRIPLATYHHDLTLIDLALKLWQVYPDATWMSERQLKHDKYFDGVGKTGHLSDGLLTFPDGRQVAIELELSFKSRPRLEAILKGYSTTFSIQEVWYYGPPDVLASVKLLIEKMKIPFVKLFSLPEFLA